MNPIKIIGKLFPPKIRQKYRDYIINKKCKEHENSTNVTCPICNSSFDAFGEAGTGDNKQSATIIGKRNNARCYKCNSVERHRLMYLYFENVIKLFNKEEKLKLLHFAPEKAFYDLFSNNSNIEYYPCDLIPKNYDYIGKTKIHEIDITNIPFKENTFDFIICNHVLEHIPDDKLAMQELYRVMKGNGQGYFQAPIDYAIDKTFEDPSIVTPKEREIAYGQHDHLRFYGKDYKNKLEQIGFHVSEDKYITTFNEEKIHKYGLDKKEFIYFCRK